MKLPRFLYLALGLLISFSSFGFTGGYNLEDSFVATVASNTTFQDTIPLQERYGDHITDDTYNPFDLTTKEITEEVEYDPETGNYIIYEKIGDEFYRTPTYMTFEEYLEYKSRKQERDYFGKLAGVTTGQKSDSGKVDPISKIDVSQDLVDRLFGGVGVTIEPQGNIDLTFGVDYTKREDPSLNASQQRQGPFPDFDMDIQMNVDGKIGKKLNLGFNYDTQSTFDFDRKIKLEYDTEAFSEDDIIKKLEAGDVSFPLRSSLIKGAQSLFGLKTELLFGKLRVTGVVSQQRSNQENLSIEGGAVKQEFEVRPTEYDENRHFFLSHYHRDHYEEALEEVPYINSLMQINNVEVWISNFRTDNAATSSQILALSDLGETTKFHNIGTVPNPMVPGERKDDEGIVLPDNFANDLYGKLQTDDETRQIDNTTSNLIGQYGLEQGRDFEKFRGRKLSASEFTYHPQLGFISLNIRLRTDQVLAVAYRYNYVYCGDETFEVGEPNQTLASNVSRNPNGEVEDVNPDDVIYTKLLKPANQRVNLPTWDLMMKNVYPLGASQVGQEDFKFDIFFEDNTNGSLKRFLPSTDPLSPSNDTPLISIFNLDRLNATQDPQPDGIFDFVEGLTINTRTGSIYFPVLEPFGSSLDKLLGAAEAEKYKYQELYDNTLTQANIALERNLFVMKGEYKSSFASEISLGSWNLPRGSVRVTAGGRQLVEGQDFEIDYGIGRLRIINPSFLQPGAKISVSFEDNSLFSLQQKNLFGLRTDYEFSDNFNIGATYLRLSEKPFTEKVNLGDDPINNRIFGLDINYSGESEWVTKTVDKLPFFSTKEKSNINFMAELAALRPGHSRGINLQTEGEENEDGGIVSIDDFEGAGSPIPLGSQTNNWQLASTPRKNDEWPESDSLNQLAQGYNRAKLSWYVIDRSYRSGPDRNDPYTRVIDRTQFFENFEAPFQLTDLFTFDLSYFPDERGPYNFDPPEGSAISAGIDEAASLLPPQQIRLAQPETRWAGIMTYLNNNDFEASNIEYIDFWLLNPYIDGRNNSNHGANEEGDLIFHLGSVSEDIMQDNLQFFENAIPTEMQEVPFETTAWGEVPIDVPLNDGFVIADAELQDIGLDGLDDAGERAHFSDYIDKVTANTGIPSASMLMDPSADNFEFYGSQETFPVGTPMADNLVFKSKNFNNPQGNFPNNQGAGSAIETVRGKTTPDKEDMNGNSSLDQTESFYEYRIPLRNNGNELDTNTPFYRETKEIVGANDEMEKWYRFQVPIAAGTSINGMEGFRSIQFMRMIVKGFETQKTFRFADLEMVRNQWRRQKTRCDAQTELRFSIDDIGLQENYSKPYRLPPGIKQQQQFNSFATVLQDEKSLALNIDNLQTSKPLNQDSCNTAVFKALPLDLRVFKRMQLFVHAQQDDGADPVPNGDLEAYIRVGKDFINNYYEYSQPIYFSDTTSTDPDSIWLKENKFDFPLELFTDVKKHRNEFGAEMSERHEIPDPEKVGALVTVKGLPSLGNIKGVEIGVRNVNAEASYSGEVWINELRVSGLQERGGYAGLARLEVDLADLGKIATSASFSTLGWGALDQKVDERAKESTLEYDVSADINVGKFFPEKWGVTIPFYAQYLKKEITPEFDSYELDLTIDEVEAADPSIDSKERSKEVETVKTFNFTNVRLSNAPKGGAKPWSPSNLSLSYAQTDSERKDFLVKENITRDQRAKVEYNYNGKSNFIQPFKKVKGKWFKFIKEMNFNPLPNSYYVTTEIKRFKNTREFREPQDLKFVFDDQRFNWDRGYGLKWDLMKSLKTSYDAQHIAVVDELKQIGIKADAADRDWTNERGQRILNGSPALADQYWKNNFKKGGRAKEYNHRIDATYNVPLKNFPLTDWITVKAKYGSDYRWTAAALNVTEFGNIIENGQKRSMNASFNFDKLYKKSGFLKKIESPKRARRSRTAKRDRSGKDKVQKAPVKGKKERTSKKDDGPSTLTRALIRPLLLLRSVKFNYSNDLGTTVPGFSPETQFFGLSNGFEAPGVNFILGLQPDIRGDAVTGDNSWLHKIADKGWIVTEDAQTNQVIQKTNQTYDMKIAIEPIKDFKVDIEFKKQFSRDRFENFKVQKGSLDNFQHLAVRDVGSFETTYSGLNTLFRDVDDVYRDFKVYTQFYSNFLGTGAHADEGLAYSYGYGSTQADVVIPSFVAAYTGVDATKLDPSVNIIDEVGANNFLPRPNWTVRYSGLKKMSGLKEIFQDFTLNHAYKSTFAINQYRTNQDFDALDAVANYDLSSDNFYSRFEIPLVQITESFAPIIGVKVKTKNDLILNFEWKKTRSLDLRSSVQGTLEERRTTDLVFGIGYTFKGVNIGFLTGDKGKKKRKKKKDEEEAKNGKDKNKRGGGPSVNSNKVREMTFTMDFSLADNITYQAQLDDNTLPEPQRGQKAIKFSPAVDYNVNENLTLRWFLDYSRTNPYVNTGGAVPVTQFYSGLTARFNLN